MNARTLMQPARAGEIALGNRFVMSPLTRNRSDLDGTPNELNAEYYAQRASAGLIITEGTFPEPIGRAYVQQPGLANDTHRDGWNRVVDGVHARDGRIVAQLHHGGRISHSSLLPNGARPVAPSSVKPAGFVRTLAGDKVEYEVPRALETDEIAGVIEQLALAAERAFRAGFDGVELHAANGYLPHQFLSTSTNLRTDQYGGRVANRTRFVLEAVDALSQVRGAGRVGVKIAPGFHLHDMRESDADVLYPVLARELDRRKIAYLHVQRPFRGGQPEAAHDMAAWLRPYFSGTIVAAANYDFESARRLLASGAADLVAFGAAFIANPDLPLRFQLNAALNEPDPRTYYTHGAEGYTSYPTLEEESAAAS